MGLTVAPVVVRLGTVGDPADFTGAPADPDDRGELVAAMWAAGTSRPEWCFVAEDESGARVGRVGYRVEPTVTNPAWLGALPPAELFAFGLWLPWGHGGCDLGRVLFASTLDRLAPELPARLDVEVNPEVHDHPSERARLCDDIGMDLFQQKQGFTWRNSGVPIAPPDRLRFATVLETGRDLYQDVMARASRDTLDRNDRWYRDHTEQAHWAVQMMEYLQEDAESWLVAFYAAGDRVGTVAVSTFDPGVATITFIGVIPEHRGPGYRHDLLQTATSAAHGPGFEEILCDVDTLNKPMIDTMRNAGHLDGVRPCHIWHHRGEVATLHGG
jgi:ribosomal protein S18 acetylase RimI-like enzyme